MADARLEEITRLFTWRITSHVPYWDFAQISMQIERFEHWCMVWSSWAEKHTRLGDEAAAAGRRETAGAAYVRAASYYHWASFLFGPYPDEFRRALELQCEVWAKAAPLVDPPLELVEIPFEGTRLPGYLRRPHGVERPPLAVLIPGADSTKEELFPFTEEIVRRGVAAFAFDGPGHGLVSFDLKIRPDYEVPVRTVVDALWERDDWDHDRLAVGGISYGGMFAIRAAAFDRRIKAVASLSSWYSPAGRYPGMARISREGLHQYMGDDPASVQDAMTVEDAAPRVTQPLLQIYGALDPQSPPEHAERTAAAVRGPTTTVILEDGVHVGNNVWYRSRPLLADWLRETL